MVTTPPTRPHDEDYLRLDLQLCFSLHAASRAFNGVYRTLLKDLGPDLSAVPGDADALGTRRAAGQEDRREAAAGLGHAVAAAQAPRIGGLIERHRSRADERSVTIRLTPPGHGSARARGAVPHRLAEAVNLPPEDFHTLRTLLATLTEGLDAAGAAPCGTT